MVPNQEPIRWKWGPDQYGYVACDEDSPGEFHWIEGSQYEDRWHAPHTSLVVAPRTGCIGSLPRSNDLDSEWCRLVLVLCVTAALNFQLKLVRVQGSLALYM